MAKREAHQKQSPRQFLREWREWRKLTLEQVGEIAGYSESYLSQVERLAGRRPNKDILEGYQKAVRVPMSWLLDRDPRQIGQDLGLDDPAAFLELWENIPPEQREQALRTLRSFQRSS